MEIAVCDDDVLDRTLIASMLRRCLYENSIGGGIMCFSGAQELIYEIQDGKNFDLIFMDIYMDKIMGIEAARQLRAMGWHGMIVFISASSGFAVESYDVKAGGYLLKPVSYERLTGFMAEMLCNFENDLYHIKRRSEIISLHYNDISYIESCNSKCLLHCSSGEVFTLYKRLCEIEDELRDRRFLRCHQSFLVNMNHIVRADKSFEMDSGESVLIRQKSSREIKNRYYEYIRAEYN